MALNILKQPFIRLSYAQGANTYFTDENSNYYKLVATTASDANFTTVSTTPSDGNVIPNSATVFVTFQDNSTVIVNNLHFYGKSSSSGGGSSEPTIKLDYMSGGLPVSGSGDDHYNVGDVVLNISFSSPTNTYELGICRDIEEVEDSGSTSSYIYTWSILFKGNIGEEGRSIKVLDHMPNSTVGNRMYKAGDVIAVSYSYNDSGVQKFVFNMYVCTGYTSSGQYPPFTYNYTWQSVSTTS